MDRSLAFYFLSVALGLAACSSPVEEQNDGPESLGLAFSEEGNEESFGSGACANWRWIGISTSGVCPQPGNGSDGSWQAEHLFPPELGAPVALPPSPLNAFCLYEHTLEGNDYDIPALVKSGELERADRDCAAVSGAAEVGLGEVLAEGLEEHFFSQAGRTNVASHGPSGIRLAFLDTSRTSEKEKTYEGASRHGSTLTHVARKLLCSSEDPSSCMAHITTQLALPILEYSPASFETKISERGGFLGTLGQLAKAVRTETSRWRELGLSEHLVLNLSLAWNPKHFGGLEENVSEMSVPVQAVYRSLEDAACRGALVVAAAGNRSGGPKPNTGALLPAAWERRRAPSLNACSHIEELDPSRFAQQEVDDPLVYAVAGVDSEGAPLGNSRPGAVPKLSAYGDHAVVYAGPKKGWTGTYTGSSVAAAVVSSTAAAVWQHRQELRRHELMELLYESGDPLGRDALLFPQGDNAPKVHRISLCKALRQACLGGSCEELPPNALPECKPWSQDAPLLSPRIDEFISEADFATLDASLLKSVALAEEPCTAEVHFYQAQKSPSTFCPADTFYGIADHAWTGPQPPDFPCPTCPIVEDPETLMPLNECQDVSVPYTLYIEIDPEYAGGVLTAPTLEIGGNSLSLPVEGMECLHPDEDEGLHSGDRLVVRCIEGSAISQGAPVELSFHASLHGGVRNSVIVVN